MQRANSGPWKVRPAGARDQGRAVSFDRLAEAINGEDVGDLDEVLGPGETKWRAVVEHPELAIYVPSQRRVRGWTAEDADTDMTPMIDVTFQLLIFFMVTATYTIQKTLDLPSSKPAEESQATAPLTMSELERNNVMVRIAADGTVTIEDQVVPLDQLVTGLGTVIRSKKSTELALDVHDAVDHDTLVQVLDAAGAAHIEKVLFVSRVAPRRASGIP
jgi:biopolymer transport protein ExbD